MALVETNLGIFAKVVEVELPERLPPYRRTAPQQRSREMQRAAFSEARKVTDFEYEQLIETVRAFREWLKDEGDHEQDYPDHAEAPIDTYFKRDNTGVPGYEVGVTLKPWEQSSGRNNEPYSKFGFGLQDEGLRVVFDLNFNDTYDLIVAVPGAKQKFEINQLNRINMTKPEHDFIMSCIRQIGEHFGYTHS